MPEPRGPCVLIVLDGWGIAPPGPGNALSLARTPNMDRYWDAGPRSTLAASGLAVGLPEGQIGNSEVGHLNLGAGYRVLQELPRIDDEIARGAFFENEALAGAMEVARERGTQVHLLGLFSYGGVHSHAEHLYATLELAARRGLQDRVAVHCFLDGRDTAPEQALEDLPKLEAKLRETGAGRIATVSGRYYAMDRDHRWDRVQKAYAALVLAQGPHAPTAEEAVRLSYVAGITDEFIVPTVIGQGFGDCVPAGPPEGGQIQLGGPGERSVPRHTGRISDGDVIIWLNFRADRSRELTQALLLPHFTAFDRTHHPNNLHLVTLTQYESSLPVHAIAYPPQLVDTPIAKVVADAGLSQCHLAETEKYAHVTYFFNGGREEPFDDEERILIASPKVATYDLQPEMSARGVAAAAVKQLESGKHTFLVMNFANGDMVGHTGKLDAAIAAAEVVDAAVGEVVDATLAAGGFVAISADHGNAEQMVDPNTNEPKTAHTENPVPFILVGAPSGTSLKEHGVLADVAPTLLTLMHLPIPPAMKEHGLT